MRRYAMRERGNTLQDAPSVGAQVSNTCLGGLPFCVGTHIPVTSASSTAHLPSCLEQGCICRRQKGQYQRQIERSAHTARAWHHCAWDRASTRALPSSPRDIGSPRRRGQVRRSQIHKCERRGRQWRIPAGQALYGAQLVGLRKTACRQQRERGNHIARTEVHGGGSASRALGRCGTIDIQRKRGRVLPAVV